MVKEWEENIDQYQGYLTEDLATISKTFLQSGQYTGDLGDLMVLTLANMLNIPITVFTSVNNMPVLCIMPTTQSVLSTQPLFLAFTQSGPGHYDAVIATTGTSNPPADVRKKCYCGRKPNFNADSCISTRCPCFLKNKECTHLCRCKSCKNGYGIRPPPLTTRRRMPYSEQSQPLAGRKTEFFERQRRSY